MIPKRILLIEDDPDIQRLLGLTLQLTAGAEVQSATEGQDGITLAVDWQPELILLDRMLPDMEGTAVLQALKANPATSTIPVIFLSARAGEAEIIAAISKGAVGYIVKPFDPMGLAGEIARILEGAR
ncbi:MAG TPA: response regulator [Symbiobacteriaceae bacterium]|nr:response regulator [Symbiobacteriaceae bacterium]